MADRKSGHMPWDIEQAMPHCCRGLNATPVRRRRGWYVLRHAMLGGIKNVSTSRRRVCVAEWAAYPAPRASNT